jgi:hypothetical protein
LKIRKDNRFIVVGYYPSWWKKFSFTVFDGPEYFGELYHEACYLESIGKSETRQKDEGVKP